MNRHVNSAAVRGFLVVLALMAFAAPVLSQALAAPPAPIPLPDPKNFVSNLDVRCYRIERPIQLFLDHLNPLFIDKGLAQEFVDLDPHQLCVPVYKNNHRPPEDALPFLRYVDWRCYGISGPPLNLPLRLTHLNPVIAHMVGPIDDVTVREPQQLCVPVAKVDAVTGQEAIPPPEIQRLIQYLDVKCYRVDSKDAGGTVLLNHLNPLLVGNPPDPEPIAFREPFQLCVPVAKTNTRGDRAFPPDDVLRIVQQSDVLCYRMQGEPLKRTLKLIHLNPLLTNEPAETVQVSESQKFCVPVSKADPPTTDPTTGSAAGKK